MAPSDNNIDCQGDFIFRWKLQPTVAVSDDPALEFFRHLLGEMLKLAVMTHQGVDVQVDGFRMCNETTVHPLG